MVVKFFYLGFVHLDVVQLHMFREVLRDVGLVLAVAASESASVLPLGHLRGGGSFDEEMEIIFEIDLVAQPQMLLNDTGSVPQFHPADETIVI